MKTKYVISGGYANRTNAENDKFFREILSDTKDTANILVVLFAKPDNETKSRYIIVQDQFDRNNNGKILHYHIARRDSLVEQIKEADIIYIHGGETMQLINEIRSHPNFLESIKSKIVAGESAGTYLLSNTFYSKSIGRLERGLEVLPIKVICHFSGLHEEKLDSVQGDLEKVLLKDYQHKVYIQ